MTDENNRPLIPDSWNKEIEKMEKLNNEWDKVRQRADELAPDGILSSENYEKFLTEVLDKFEEINDSRPHSSR